jgi:hypothetical protein
MTDVFLIITIGTCSSKSFITFLFVTYQLSDFQLEFLFLNEIKSQGIDRIIAYIRHVDMFLKNQTILIIFNAKSYHCSSSFDVTRFCPSVTYISSYPD